VGVAVAVGVEVGVAVGRSTVTEPPLVVHGTASSFNEHRVMVKFVVPGADALTGMLKRVPVSPMNKHEIPTRSTPPTGFVDSEQFVPRLPMMTSAVTVSTAG